MPQFFPNGACLAIAELVRSELALSKLRLFKEGFTPQVTTTRAQLLAEECDYTGYVAGGETITAFLAAILNPLGGASIDWPTEQFAAVAPFTIGNVVGGWWVEDAAGAVVYATGTFTPPIPLGAAGQGIPLAGTLVFPNGQ